MDSGKLPPSESKQPGVEDYITFLETLKLRCRKLAGVTGVSKLEKKINAEKKFLNWLKAQDEITQKSHLKSSNLSNFSSLVHAAELLPGVVQILQPFATPAHTESLVVDIVAAGGHAWVKVIARKAQALHLVWAGQGQFGERDLVKQAQEYLECAARHPHEFSVPQVHFAFYNQVTEQMANYLKSMGVIVWGETVSVDTAVQAKLETWVDDDGQASGTDQSDSEEWCVQDTSYTDNKDQQDSLKCELSYRQQSPAFSSLETPNITSSSAQPHPDTIEVCEIVDEFQADDGAGGCARTPETNMTVEKCSLSQKYVHVTSSADIFHSLFLHLVTSPPSYDSLAGSSALTVDQSVTSITRVNLDITTLIALVSSVTNGSCDFVFRDRVLTLQAKEERENPMLPVLQDYLKDKDVFVCETAMSSFQSILEILGGPAEKRRAEELVERVRVVKDQPSQRAMALDCQGRVKERSKVIFGTGDSLQAVTVTSNMGFVRAAKSQGVVLSVFLHPARALTEKKEQHAIPLLKEQKYPGTLGDQMHSSKDSTLDISCN